MEKAQALGLKFCEENFPGHPAIVCTHPDGHNHSGNIHVHIVIGSVRTREVERKPYMQKPRDWREGMKHSSTAQTMRHLRVEVMELCEGAGLYQIDLLNGSKERVSEAEYWARRRGQLKLDRKNAVMLATGQQPAQTKFETAKEILRKQISDVLNADMHRLARADFPNRKQIVHEILHPEDRPAPQKRIYGINYSALEAAVRRIQQDVDFLMKYLPKVPDDAYVKVETTKILKQHKAYMAQFEEMLNDEKIA